MIKRVKEEMPHNCVGLAMLKVMYDEDVIEQDSFWYTKISAKDAEF